MVHLTATSWIPGSDLGWDPVKNPLLSKSYKNIEEVLKLQFRVLDEFEEEEESEGELYAEDEGAESEEEQIQVL
jgi:hypothetical protein